MLHFFDTNIVLYAVDTRDKVRGPRALELLSRHILEKNAVISTQVLQETYHNATRKFGIPQVDAIEWIIHLSRELPVVNSDAKFVIESLRLCQRWQISVWDGLMVNAAITSNCKVLFTEDLSHGQIIEGVRITNPFKP